MVRRLSVRAGLSTQPVLALIESDVANALTFGSPDQPMIGVTRGILRRLQARELNGVLAHEIGHVAQGDLHVMAIADAVVLTGDPAGLASALQGLERHGLPGRPPIGDPIPSALRSHPATKARVARLRR